MTAPTPPATVSAVAQLEVAKLQKDLILKPLEAHVLGAPMSVAPISQLTSGAGALLNQLPTGWHDVGLIDKDAAITWSRKMTNTDINAIGFRDPVRSDIVSDVFGLEFKGLETNRWNIENYLNVDLSALTPTATTGEVAFDQPTNARIRQSRFLTISRDGSGVDTVFIARMLFAGQISDVKDQTISDGKNGLEWTYTINSRVDTTAGVSVRHFFGGPGWRTMLVAAGFPPVTP